MLVLLDGCDLSSLGQHRHRDAARLRHSRGHRTHHREHRIRTILSMQKFRFLDAHTGRVLVEGIINDQYAADDLLMF